MGDIDFEEQLELERLEKEKKEKDGHPAEKVDPDGTVYEWDYDKKAWFPKIDAAFIAQYQMNYGVDAGSQEDKTAQETPADASAQSYHDYYSYGQAAEGTADQSAQEEYQEDSAEVMAQYTEEQKKHYNDYWSYYYNTDYHDYYTDCMAQHSAGNQAATAEAGTKGEAGIQGEAATGNQADSDFHQWKTDQGLTSENTGDNKEEKKGKKRKKVEPKRPEGWFSVEEKHNTNVYVSGLPLDITTEEFAELMAKYGLIMFDPRSKKPKVKLYTDENGQPKGDGRCCFIKKESVDLALDLLDGLELRGHTVSVERASFEMKGNFDPSKKKKRLTNKEKNRIRERQAKLFDWRPDKPRNARLKHEKVVVLKNIFDAKVFEDSPVLINKVSADIRKECEKYGSVKKVVVYDRHQDGVVIVHFKEPEEADMCVEYMNRRFWGDRRVIAETWDGETKYEVSETEAEREARLKKWEDYLEKGEEGAKTYTETGNPGSETGNPGSETGNPGSETGNPGCSLNGSSVTAVDDWKNGQSLGVGNGSDDVLETEKTEQSASVEKGSDDGKDTAESAGGEKGNDNGKDKAESVSVEKGSDSGKDTAESAGGDGDAQGESKDVEMGEVAAATDGKNTDTAGKVD